MDNDFDILKLKEKIASLQQAILSVHPTLPILLKDIHKILKDDPQCVTILEEADIAIIVSGLKQQTKTEITQAMLKTATKKTLSKVTLDDL